MNLMHISDIHFLLNNRHDEYKQVLKNLFLYSNIDYIIIAGDVFNDKSKLSPEVIEIFDWFITNLSKIAKQKIIIVPGNHDKNEKNNNRLDAVSPVINMISNNINYNNIIFSNKTEVIELEDLVIVNYSIFEKLEYKNLFLTEEQKKKPVIGIYHGIINNLENDIGFKLQTTEKHDFSLCDLVCCGDIHKRSIFNVNGVLCGMAGSVLQQNFGESEEKGGIIWTINSKENIKYKFFNLNNPYLFKTIKLSEYDSVKSNIKSTWKIRIDDDLNDTLKLNKASKELNNQGFEIKLKANNILREDKIDLSNIKTLKNINQNIKEKYKEIYDIYGDDLIEINSKYYNKVMNTEISSGIWTIKKLKWSNLFNFGPDNSLDFEDYKNNVLLINGPNYSGKSSFISSITFALFGSWTKDPAKYSDYINKNKTNASSFIEIDKNGKRFSIERKLTTTGKITSNVVEFWNITDKKLLNGDSVNETEKNIEKYFGTLENFKLTTLITQFDNLGFINEKSTKRKEILNQFISLDFFKTIDNLVSKDLTELKIKISTNEQLQKEYSNFKLIDIDSLIEKDNEFNKKIKNNYWNTDKHKELINNYQINLKNLSLNKEKEILSNQLNELIKEGIDIQSQYDELNLKKDILINLINENSVIFNKTLEISKLTEWNNDMSKKTVKSVPCDFKYSDCQFLINTVKTKSDIDSNNKKIDDLKLETKNFDSQFYSNIVLEEKSISVKQLDLIKDKNKVSKQTEILLNKIKSLNNNNVINSITEDEYNLSLKTIEEINKDCNFHFNENQIIQFQINNYNKSKDKFDKLFKDSESLNYDYNLLLNYSEIIGKNGLPLLLANNYTKSISDIVTKIVSSILGLDVKLEINDTKFNIYIKHTSESEKKYRVIECGSGSEHFFVGLAIRLAFYTISNLVKSDLLIMDEPATSLDIDHQNKFGDFFQSLNLYFNNVIIVTHLDLLKQYVNKSIDISNKDGYAVLI